MLLALNGSLERTILVVMRGFLQHLDTTLQIAIVEI